MQTRELTAAEKALISLIENNLRSIQPSKAFIKALNEQIRNGTGKNIEDNNLRIYVDNPVFINALKARLDGKEISSQMLFEICKALCQQETFGNTLHNAPIRTVHVFNFLYEELVRRHQFYVNNGKVPDKIPDDINAINYELLQYFLKADPEKSEQTMCNCLLVKIAPDALSNVASDEQINKLLGGIRGLQAAPQVSQAYFDRVDKGMKPTELERQLQAQYQSTNADTVAAKPKTKYTYSAKKPEAPNQVRSASAPAAVTNTAGTLYSKVKNLVRSPSAPPPSSTPTPGKKSGGKSE